MLPGVGGSITGILYIPENIIPTAGTVCHKPMCAEFADIVIGNIERSFDLYRIDVHTECHAKGIGGNIQRVVRGIDAGLGRILTDCTAVVKNIFVNGSGGIFKIQCLFGTGKHVQTGLPFLGADNINFHFIRDRRVGSKRRGKLDRAGFTVCGDHGGRFGGCDSRLGRAEVVCPGNGFLRGNGSGGRSRFRCVFNSHDHEILGIEERGLFVNRIQREVFAV